VTVTAFKLLSRNFFCMLTRGYYFILFIQRSEVRSADYEILLIQAQVAAIWSWMYKVACFRIFQVIWKFFLASFRLPNMFAKFGIEFLTRVTKRSFVVGESSLESKSHIGLTRPVVLHCHGRLVHHWLFETIAS